MKGLKAVGFIPDLHIPFEDTRYWNLTMKVFSFVKKKYGLNQLIILGDFIDLYGLSFFSKDPAIDLAALYDKEITTAITRLNEIDKRFPKTKKVFIEGNHEYRFFKFLRANAPALSKRISIQRELEMHRRDNWKWIRYHKEQMYSVGSGLNARHEPFGNSQPKTQAMKAGCSFIHGHDHQVSEGDFITKVERKHNIAIGAGCGVNFKAHIFDFCKNRPDWGHCITLAFLNGKEFYHSKLRVKKDYTCLFDGKVFRS